MSESVLWGLDGKKRVAGKHKHWRFIKTKTASLLRQLACHSSPFAPVSG